MTLPKYKELNKLSTIIEIDQEILNLSKNLFDLKIRRSTNQSIKPHLFKHTKRRIAQLNFRKNLLAKSNILN
jgi:large subunit ribosomal protein L29